MTNNVDLRIVPDQEALAPAAAPIFISAAQQAVAARGRFEVALSGGSTPQALYTLLARPPFATAVPWTDTHIYWGDERLVPPDDPDSNYFQARQQLLDHVPVVPSQVHRMRGELAPDAAVQAYATTLQQTAGANRRWPRFDLVLLGLGADGHTASLFPGTPFTEDPVIAVTADYQGRPAGRISLTPAVLNDARQILFLVSGAQKAATLTAVLEGPGAPAEWPAQRIKPAQGQVIWLVDRAAASSLAQH